MGQTGWKSELSLIDEFFGKEPRYPLATKLEHQEYEFHKQNELLKNLSNEQKQSLKETTNAICGSLENGFSELYNINTTGFNSIISAIENSTEEITEELGEVNRNLEKINSTLSWGFSALIEQMTLTNQKLDQIIHLLNIPDSQKQRKYHIEQGFDFIKKSKINKVFFNKAKQHFEDVIKIEDADYLSLQQLGIIHLYSNELLDLELSEKYFEQSILYSNSDIGFARNQQNSSSFHFTFNPTKITANSLMHLARNYYIREDYQKAFNTALKGLEIYKMVGIYFDLSKYSASLNNEEDSLHYLNKAISMDRYIAVKVLTEEKLIKENYVQSFLKNLEIKTTSKALTELNEIEHTAHQNSVFKQEISNIKNLTSNKTYLKSLEALEKIGYELEN
jgi:tetratricopeptide (TPR) repeat protein